MAWSADDLARLERAIARGVLRVEYQDRTVQYQSLADMMRLRTQMRAELAPPPSGGGTVFAGRLP